MTPLSIPPPSDADPDLLAAIAKRSGCTDVAKVTTFEMWRGQVRVQLDIYDVGIGSDARWRIVATDEYGRTATGNPDSTLDLALSTVHWQHLDAPLPSGQA